MIRIIPTSFMYRNKLDYYSISRIYVDNMIRWIRVNWSRFSDDEYIWQINNYREAFSSMGIDLKVLLDLPTPGRKYRIFFNKTGPYDVEKNHLYHLFCTDTSYIATDDEKSLFLPDVNFYNIAKCGEEYIVGDGEVEFLVMEKLYGNHLCIKALNSGSFILGKSISSKENTFIRNRNPFDKSRMKYIVQKTHPSAIALSFCENIDDILYYLDCTDKTPIIPKIETEKSVQFLSEMSAYCKTIMLGRGDLGNTNKYSFGYFQQQIIETARQTGMHIIAATGILDSLSKNISIPPRAELTDLYYLLNNQISTFVASSGVSRNPDAIQKFCDFMNYTVKGEIK